MSRMDAAQVPQEPAIVAVGHWEFYAYFLHLGATGFGGPIALAGFMQRDLVDERRWISRQDYLDGLALAQLAPGPLAAQLAMYLGTCTWRRRRRDARVCLFHPALVPDGLGDFRAYVRFGGLSWMQALFYGIGAAVIGIIARSAFKLTRLTLGRNALLWTIFVAMTLATAWTEREIAWLFVAAGLVTAAPLGARAIASRGTRHAAGAMLLTLAAPAAAASYPPTLGNVFWLFAKAGAFVFGSGLAIVPFLYGELVQSHAWLWKGGSPDRNAPTALQRRPFSRSGVVDRG